MGNKRWVKVLKVVVVILITVLLLFGFWKVLERVREMLPGHTKAEIESYYKGITQDYTYVLLEDKPLELEHYPKTVDGKMYLPIKMVTSYINDHFFWDDTEKVLTYTTAENVIRMRTDELTYYVNDSPLQLEMPILVLEEVPYIPLDVLQKFTPYEFKYNVELDMLMVEDPTQERIYGTIMNKATFLRMDQSEKSDYIRKMAGGEKVRIFEESALWYRVKTEDGYVGYLLKEHLGDVYQEFGGKEPVDDRAFPDLADYGDKVNIVWHQVTNLTANSYLESALEGVHGVDVLSPTWFALSDSNGNISNIADITYVQYAHQNGYKVWALFSNGFDSARTHDVLSSTTLREKVIKQILAYAAIYELDGINIDFESVARDDGVYFVQFMRELVPYLKSQGLVVSVDMYVPTEWTEHYNRKALGEIIDYLIIMGYDEHYAGSENSGSVASIGFVEQGIIDTLASVPKEKVILGLPYYTRLWWEETLQDGSIDVSSKAYSMQAAYDILVENGATITYNEGTQQYYGSYTKDGLLYKCWLEEERSIEEKVKRVIEYDLAGVSGWKLGLEKDIIWDVLWSYLEE